MSQPLDLSAPLVKRPASMEGSATMNGAERVHMLGHPIDLTTPAQVLEHLKTCVQLRRRSVVGNHNLHSLYLMPRTPRMQPLYDRAEIIQLDSTPLVAYGRLLGLPVSRQNRSTYLDWRDDFWPMAAAQGWRVYCVAGAEGVVATGAERLMARYPGVVIAGRSGFFDATKQGKDNAAVLAQIAEFKPDIVFVGMGMPRQEIWIAENLEALPACPILPIGAAFDYEAGVQKAAPRWMGRIGLEWLFRLTVDPKRLFSRYCLEPWFLIGPAVRDVLGRGQR